MAEEVDGAESKATNEVAEPELENMSPHARKKVPSSGEETSLGGSENEETSDAQDEPVAEGEQAPVRMKRSKK